MKEKPILFNGAMVRAVLDGSKTHTRRAMKPQLLYGDVCGLFPSWYLPTAQGSGILYPNGKDTILAMCHHGRPGDHLWVRETFYAYGRWVTRYSEKKKRDEWHFIDMTVECDRAYQYAADNPDVPLATDRGGALPGWYKRHAIFMPRAVSRIQLEIIGIRVERLQDISEADSVAEGIRISSDCRRSEACYGIYECNLSDGKTHFNDSAYELFKKVWNSTGGDWDANPWVWVVEFKRVKP
ncbi:hypothetical protein ACO0LB_18545 [Undibacterium sp. SXout7W]|uniref:hypothetical protein n=1 Tax=Undibacterium sp. SXout7W TaxID=3413049 RepID=UPI003BF041BC